MFLVRYFFLKPFSLIYSLILRFRHWLYDENIIFSSKKYPNPIIVLGNLSLGGSGKTPHTIYITKLLSSFFDINIVSRGYGRITDELRIVNTLDSYKDVGDEPLMMKRALENTSIYVSKKRNEAIEYILSENKESVILLDDAYQHRPLQAGFNILLTDYHKIYVHDYLLPLGSLRDIKSRADKAKLIIVTKSDKNLSQEKRNEVIIQLNINEQQTVLFSSIKYLKPIDYYNKMELDINNRIILVTAIANAKLLKEYLSSFTNIEEHFKYSDHKEFVENNVKSWISMAHSKSINQIVTTEKDAVRLDIYKDLFVEANIQLIVIPITIDMSDEDRVVLEQKLMDYIKSYQTH